MKLFQKTKILLVAALFATVGIVAAGCTSDPPPPADSNNGGGGGPTSLPKLADAWSKADGTGAYDKFKAGQWASDANGFTGTISSLTSILAAINAGTACDKTVYSDCTAPAGVTAGQVQYILDLGNALKQINSIVSLVGGYLAPQRAAISSDTILSLYPSITDILTKTSGKGMLDYIGKAYDGYVAAAPASGVHPYDFTFTGGSITLGSKAPIVVTNLPIDTAGISVLQMLNQLLRGVMNLVESLNATAGDVTTNPTATVLLGMLLSSDANVGIATAPFCMPWVTSTTNCSNKAADIAKFADFAKVKQTANLAALGDNFLGASGAFKVLVAAYDKIVASSSYTGLITYDGTNLGLGTFITSFISTTATFPKADADKIRGIINGVVNNYIAGTATDLAALINANMTTAAIDYLACTNGTGTACADSSTPANKSYYAIIAADITALVPSVNLKTLMSATASPLVQTAFDFRKFFPVALTADDTDGVRGNDFKVDENITWSMVKTIDGTTSCTLTTVGDTTCVKGYTASGTTGEITFAMKATPVGKIATSSASTDSSDFVASASLGDKTHTVSTIVDAGTANAVIDPSYLYFWGGYTTLTSDDKTLYSVIAWPGTGLENTKLNGTITTVMAIGEYLL